MPVDVWEKVLENPPAPLTQVSGPMHSGIQAAILKYILISCDAECFTSASTTQSYKYHDNIICNDLSDKLI